MKMEQAQRSETLPRKIQTQANRPKEIIQHSQHGESLKSRIQSVLVSYTCQLPMKLSPDRQNHKPN
jgi:hypothetical protein